MTSAKHSTGSISPVDGLAPKVIASNGTVRIASPRTPVFDIPTKTAIIAITTHDHSLCMYVEKSIIQVRSVSLLFILRAKLLIFDQ